MIRFSRITFSYISASSALVGCLACFFARGALAGAFGFPFVVFVRLRACDGPAASVLSSSAERGVAVSAVVASIPGLGERLLGDTVERGRICAGMFSDVTTEGGADLDSDRDAGRVPVEDTGGRIPATVDAGGCVLCEEVGSRVPATEETGGRVLTVLTGGAARERDIELALSSTDGRCAIAVCPVSCLAADVAGGC